MLFILKEEFDDNDFIGFYVFYYKYILPLKNMLILLPANYSYFLIFLILIIIIGVFLSFLTFLTETKDEPNIIKEMKFTNNWQFISDKLKLRQDVALSELHKASDKCYAKNNCNKCIELATYWPHLINATLPDFEGITPFHRVCYRGNHSLIEFMLSKGANIFQETNFGENAFHMLFAYYIRNPAQKNFKCLDLLLKNGYSLRKDKTLKKLILNARETENTELEKWLSSNAICIDKKHK
ncbi:uncharacterized protein LOC122506465 [Leptopilina heterotoma]|uniref:uncharacterized protein LOC122506465 n=1 Tax=Leptopilina heterotoma TaxID=63436 RepID=UPI001CA9F51C|nr:uncharacterized protein LOC122506465 [Leptopilina heterotoma]